VAANSSKNKTVARVNKRGIKKRIHRTGTCGGLGETREHESQPERAACYDPETRVSSHKDEERAGSKEETKRELERSSYGLDN